MAGAPSPAREARALRGFDLQFAGTVRWIAQSLARCQLFALPPKMPTRSENAVHLFLNSREQRHRFTDNVTVRQTAPLRVVQTKSLFFSNQFHLPIELIENSMRRPRQHRRNQDRDYAQRFSKVIENASQRVRVITVFGKFPGRAFFDEPIAIIDEVHDCLNSKIRSSPTHRVLVVPEFARVRSDPYWNRGCDRQSL